MMNDSVCDSETASCTAITEKRQDHRAGGCTGILFRLLDWNRRFAKKKLFSRKLLPPAHQAKQAAKKFQGDEKMPIPKLHLIADENRGGFPKLKKNAKGADIVQKQDMRSPCLVARLMGLELMPAVQRDKAKKPSRASSNEDRRHEFVVASTCEEGGREGLRSEKGQLKHEIRPQKVQKTGLSERQALTRFAPEGMQFKGVLSRNRKHHHPRLATPAKSPRASSARTVSRVSRSRLIDAATKILEPGLVAKNKCRYALSYPRDMTCTPPDKVMLVGSQFCSADRANRSASARHIVGHAVCMNCGYLQENEDFGPIVSARLSECAAPNSNLVDTLQQSGVTQPRPSLSPGKQEKMGSCVPSQPNAVSLATRLNNDLLEHHGLLRDEIPVPPIFQEHRGRTESKQKGESSSVASKQGSMKQSSLPSGEERMPTRGKVGTFRKRRITSPTDSVDGGTASVGFNCRPTAQTDEMVSAELETSNTDACVARGSCFGRANCSPHLRTPVQKRRFINVERLYESRSFVSSTPRIPKCPVLTGKAEEFQVHYYNDAIMKRRPHRQAKGATASCSNVVNSAISLAPNPSLMHMGKTRRSSCAADPSSNCCCMSRNSGLEAHPCFRDKVYDHPGSFGFGNLNKREELHRYRGTDLYARTSKYFCNFGVSRASRYKLNHEQTVAIDAELLFVDANSFRTCCVEDSRVISFLLNKLEESASPLLSNITGFMHSDTENRQNQFREFLLDCLSECLDSRFSCHDELSPWKKLPLSVDLDTLIQDVQFEIRSWAGLSGMSIDEVIEWEIGHSFEKWTDFRTEALENGIAIDSYIFQSLVEEILEDLHGACKLKDSV